MNNAQREKHTQAEKPGELYWNEVTGLGALADIRKIAELEGEVKRLKSLVAWNVERQRAKTGNNTNANGTG